jgi:hypothetical protein
MKVSFNFVALLLAATIAPCSFGQSPGSNSGSAISKDPIRRSGPNIPGPGEKVINRARSNIYDPVSMGKIFFKGLPIKPGEPFPAGDDWLKYIEVEIKNTSHKPLIAGQIRIDFRELGSPLMMWAAGVGRIPEFALYRATGEKVNRVQTQPEILIPPGGLVTISLARDYEDLVAYLGLRTPLNNVSACGIDLDSFYFADDTRWSQGSYVRADHDHPGRHISISRDEFNEVPKNKITDSPGAGNNSN